MKSLKVRMIVAYLIGIMPTSGLRVFLYRTIFGYRISRSYIGWKTRIVVNDAELTECHIGGGNQFVGPMRVTIKKDATVGNNNVFDCGWWTNEEQFKSARYDRHLEIGMDTRITSGHYFDVAGSFILGNHAWIAGCGSQFWTHGAGSNDRNISIGERCYIGSAVRFAPGTSVGNNSIVGIGSVVTKKISSENVIVAGQPAKIVRENYDWKTQQDMS